MKRILAFALCLTTLLSLCACGETVDGGDLTSDTDITTTVTTDSTVVSATTTVTELTTDTTTVPTTTEAPVVEEGLLYQAHRGLSTDFPENTMPAFRGAIDAGFKFIELDPNFTADGRCVLMHDSTVNRTCRKADGSSLGEAGIDIKAITYAQLQEYDAGIFKGARFKGTKVPLLSEVAELVKGTGVSLKIDNKIQNFNALQFEIVCMIAEQYPEEIGITCKDLEFVRLVINRLPNAIIHYDGDVNEKICKRLREIVGDNELYIWFPVANATENICNTIKQYGHLGLWTVKSEAELQKAEKLGADLIETNGEVKP